MDSKGQWHLPPEDLGDYPIDSDYPFLIGDAGGNLHLGYEWFWRNPDFYRTRYRKKPAGGPWRPTEDLSVNLDSNQSAPSLTVVPGDTVPHAVFEGGPTPSLMGYFHWRIYYRNKPDTAWSQLWELFPYTQYSNPWFWANVTADSQGHLYAAWILEQTYQGGNVVDRNLWMREQQYAPYWRAAFKVTNDTIPLGAPSGYINGYPSLGYPVTENGVDITWIRTYSDSAQIIYYLMYKRLPSLLGVEQEKEKAPPREPELTLTPRPNPAKTEMELTYGIPKEGMVNLTVYNLMGEQVRTLVHGPNSAGVYRVRWNGRDEKLREAPSGTYFFQLTVGKKQVIKKGTLVR